MLPYNLFPTVVDFLFITPTIIIPERSEFARLSYSSNLILKDQRCSPKLYP